MNIDKEFNGEMLLVRVSGRLDTTTAPQLETELAPSLEEITELVLDLSELEYLSSAGLRVLLAAQKQMNRQGEMIVKNANETIMEIFEITGFTEILHIDNETK